MGAKKRGKFWKGIAISTGVGGISTLLLVYSVPALFNITTIISSVPAWELFLYGGAVGIIVDLAKVELKKRIT